MEKLKLLLKDAPSWVQERFVPDNLKPGTHIFFTDDDEIDTYCLHEDEIDEINEATNPDEPGERLVGIKYRLRGVPNTDPLYTAIPLASIWVVNVIPFSYTEPMK